MKNFVENILYGIILAVVCYGIYFALRLKGGRDIAIPDIKAELANKPLPEIINSLNDWLS